MSVLLRSEDGDEVADIYEKDGDGKYFDEKEVASVKKGQRYEILCADGRNYIVEVKELNPKTLKVALHFYQWSKKYDYEGFLKDLYITNVGTFSEGLNCSTNTYSDEVLSGGEKKKLKDHHPRTETSATKTAATEKKKSNYKENTRYDDNFLSKPRLFTGSSRRRKDGDSEQDVKREEEEATTLLTATSTVSSSSTEEEQPRKEKQYGEVGNIVSQGKDFVPTANNQANNNMLNDATIHVEPHYHNNNNNAMVVEISNNDEGISNKKEATNKNDDNDNNHYGASELKKRKFNALHNPVQTYSSDEEKKLDAEKREKMKVIIQDQSSDRLQADEASLSFREDSSTSTATTAQNKHNTIINDNTSSTTSTTSSSSSKPKKCKESSKENMIINPSSLLPKHDLLNNLLFSAQQHSTFSEAANNTATATATTITVTTANTAVTTMKPVVKPSTALLEAPREMVVVKGATAPIATKELPYKYVFFGKLQFPPPAMLQDTTRAEMTHKFSTFRIQVSPYPRITLSFIHDDEGRMDCVHEEIPCDKINTIIFGETEENHFVCYLRLFSSTKLQHFCVGQDLFIDPESEQQENKGIVLITQEDLSEVIKAALPDASNILVRKSAHTIDMKAYSLREQFQPERQALLHVARTQKEAEQREPQKQLPTNVATSSSSSSYDTTALNLTDKIIPTTVLPTSSDVQSPQQQPVLSTPNNTPNTHNNTIAVPIQGFQLLSTMLKNSQIQHDTITSLLKQPNQLSDGDSNSSSSVHIPVWYREHLVTLLALRNNLDYTIAQLLKSTNANTTTQNSTPNPVASTTTSSSLQAQ